MLEQLQLILHLLFQPVVLLDLVLQFALLGLQVGFDLLGPLFALGDLVVALVDLAVVFAFELYELLFRLEDLLLFDHLAFGLGLFDRGFATFLHVVADHVAGDRRVDGDADDGGDAGYQNVGTHHLSVLLLFRLLMCIHKKTA